MNLIDPDDVKRYLGGSWSDVIRISEMTENSYDDEIIIKGHRLSFKKDDPPFHVPPEKLMFHDYERGTIYRPGNLSPYTSSSFPKSRKTPFPVSAMIRAHTSSA